MMDSMDSMDNMDTPVMSIVSIKSILSIMEFLIGAKILIEFQTKYFIWNSRSGRADRRPEARHLRRISLQLNQESI